MTAGYADMNGPSVVGFILGALFITALLTVLFREGLGGLTNGPVSRAADLCIAALVAVLCVSLSYVIAPDEAAAPATPIDYSRRMVARDGRVFVAPSDEAYRAALERRGSNGELLFTSDTPAVHAARRARRESTPAWILEHTRFGNVAYPAASLFWALVNLARPRGKRRALAHTDLDEAKTKILTADEHDAAARRSRAMTGAEAPAKDDPLQRRVEDAMIMSVATSGGMSEAADALANEVLSDPGSSDAAIVRRARAAVERGRSPHRAVFVDASLLRRLKASGTPPAQWRAHESARGLVMGEILTNLVRIQREDLLEFVEERLRDGEEPEEIRRAILEGRFP